MLCLVAEKRLKRFCLAELSSIQIFFETLLCSLFSHFLGIKRRILTCAGNLRRLTNSVHCLVDEERKMWFCWAGLSSISVFHPFKPLDCEEGI